MPHKVFDDADGNRSIADGQGVMQTTAPQMGELVDTAQRVSNVTEIQLIITNVSPRRESTLTS